MAAIIQECKTLLKPMESTYKLTPHESGRQFVTKDGDLSLWLPPSAQLWQEHKTTEGVVFLSNGTISKYYTDFFPSKADDDEANN
jgi:hypothetical protein